MDAYRKYQDYFKVIYSSFYCLSFLSIILGCGGGGNAGSKSVGIMSENLSFQQTCKYPPMVSTLSPFNVPEIPQFPTIISYGNKYHVDKERGSNSNDGSFRNPWATLQYGVNQLTAGDTLIVHAASTGYDEWVYVANTGTNENWITIKGVDGEKVILQGGLTFNSTAEFILFKNIDIKGALWTLIDISNNSHDLAIDNAAINCQSSTDNYTGVFIKAGVHNVWFRNMDIHNCGYKKLTPTDASGVYMVPESITDPLITDITFMNVTVRDNKGDGIGSSAVDSIYLDGCEASNNTGDGFDIAAKTRAVIKNSVSANNGIEPGLLYQGVGLKIWSKETWLINSLIYDNYYDGVLFVPKEDNSKLYILNSTFVDDDLYNRTGYGTNQVYLYNNIFYSINRYPAVIFEDISKQTLAGEDNNYYFSAYDDVAFEFRDNLVVDRAYTISEMGNGKWYASEGFGEHNIGKILDGNSCQLN